MMHALIPASGTQPTTCIRSVDFGKGVLGKTVLMMLFGGRPGALEILSCGRDFLRKRVSAKRASPRAPGEKRRSDEAGRTNGSGAISKPPNSVQHAIQGSADSLLCQIIFYYTGLIIILYYMHSTKSYCMIMCYTVLYYIRISCVLCRAVLCCAVLYCTVLYCTVLYCTVLYCTVLHCALSYYTIILHYTMVHYAALYSLC